MSESRPFAVVRPLDEHEKWERDAEHDDVFAIEVMPRWRAAALPARSRSPEVLSGNGPKNVGPAPKRRRAA